MASSSDLEQAHEVGGQVCPQHPEGNVIEDNRTCDRICTECGLVLGKSVDEEAEWRTFSKGREKKDQSRVGGPVHSMICGTDFGTTMDLQGCSSSLGEIQRRHRKNEIRGMDSDLIRGFNLIETITSALSLNRNVQNRAENIFKEIFANKAALKNMKKSMSAMAAASLYIATRQEGTHILYALLCKHARIKKLQIGRYYKFICKILKINLDTVTAENYIEPFCEKLNLPKGIQDAALAVANSAVKMDLVAGRSPVALAAASLYLVSQASSMDLRRTRSEIAGIAGISEITISSVYRTMTLKAGKLLPKGFPLGVIIEELPLF